MRTNDVLVGNLRTVEAGALGSLLRTELSACETYRTAVRAIELGEDCPALSLRCLYRTHRRFADELRSLIRGLGGLPAEPLASWGVWAGVHERVASMRGRADGPAMLRALRHGERYSLELARGALHDLEGPAASWVKERLVDGLAGNLGLLDALERPADGGALQELAEA